MNGIFNFFNFSLLSAYNPSITYKWSDYILTNSNCATFDGVEDYISASHLIGTETIMSSKGTSTPTISAGRIDFTAGTMYNLVLSDGTIYPFSEGVGTTIYDASGNGNHGTAVNTDDATFWANTQDEFHWNLTKGFNQKEIRLPTEAELVAETTSALTPVTNSATAASSFLKLPAAGFRNHTNATLRNVGRDGLYWTSTVNGTRSRGLYFHATAARFSSNTRAYGFTVRCIVSENSTLSVGDTYILDGLSYGVIQSPYTGRLWLDRNLGASQVATSSTDADAYGDLYQWGREADGHEKRDSATTATLASDVINVGSDFITSSVSPYDWTTADSSTGMRQSINSAKIPALADGTVDALGNTISNPTLPAPNSNGAETTIGDLL